MGEQVIGSVGREISILEAFGSRWIGNFSCEINKELLKFLFGPFCRKIFALVGPSTMKETKRFLQCHLFSPFALLLQDLLFKVHDQPFLLCLKWKFCCFRSRPTQKVFTELNRVMGFLFSVFERNRERNEIVVFVAMKRKALFKIQRNREKEPKVLKIHGRYRNTSDFSSMMNEELTRRSEEA